MKRHHWTGAQIRRIVRTGAPVQAHLPAAAFPPSTPEHVDLDWHHDGLAGWASPPWWRFGRDTGWKRVRVERTFRGWALYAEHYTARPPTGDAACAWLAERLTDAAACGYVAQVNVPMKRTSRYFNNPVRMDRADRRWLRTLRPA